VIERPCVSRVLRFLVVVPILITGCDRAGRLPTATSPLSRSDVKAAGARDEPTLETKHGGHQHLPPRVLIAEAKEGLEGVLTGEQVYFQEWITFTDVPDTADFRVALGVYLGDLLRRWSFSVSSASTAGFVAKAEGHDDTQAEGMSWFAAAYAVSF
jgi:hypothetical protein